MFPPPSEETPTGKLICAVVAEIPSPLYPATPVPATVLTSPVAAVTFRIRLFPESARYRLSAPSTHRPQGLLIWVLAAANPSPLKPAAPVPRKVVMLPVATVTFRTRWLYRSAMYTLPAESTAAALHFPGY